MPALPLATVHTQSRLPPGRSHRHVPLSPLTMLGSTGATRMHHQPHLENSYDLTPPGHALLTRA